MDFFERQHQAKKKTGYLVFLFGVAVLLISLLNFLIIAAVIPLVGEERKREGLDFSTLQDPMLAMSVMLGTFVVISLAGLYRKSQLSDGGSSIAAMMGGRLVNMATTDPDERKLMNVVEEMAIASSVAVPEVYVMEGEEAINAFAAGYTLDDAVIGVTEGCMRKLSRDELQGVIAHEFSHILNQDMKLNLRLVAVVFGLISLAVIGRVLLRIGFYSSHGRSRRSSENGGGGAALAIGIIGLGLMVTSGLGILMGNLIKSAVSRQREYLADSSAVQYTRNPEGLAGALKKIGAMATGSRLLTPHAEEASHMLFGNGMRESWFSFAATHPPLLDRILLLEPSFDGDFSGVKFEERRSSAAKPDSKARRTQAGIPIPGVGDALGQALPPVIMGLAAAGQVQVGSAAAVADSIGNPTQQHIDFAAALLASLPEAVRAAAHDTHDACALVFALLLDPKDGPVQKKQLGQVDKLFGEQMAKATLKLSADLASLDPRAKLPVADLAVGSLRRMAKDQFERFTKLLESLAAADEKIDLFEFSLSKLVIRHLEPHFLKQQKKTARYYSLKKLSHECSVLISSLACTAGSNDETIQTAYAAGASHLDATRLTQLPDVDCGLQELDQALVTLDGVSINLKRKLIEAAAATVSADGYLQIQEAELLRAISDSLGCPMPPLAIALATAA